ncbi:MAG: transglutaminase domain-containing protein [Actinobacteria bacterium]|nr:MAG: transglutaminase domain-containing protein [Actinomycetota bacterium]
MIRTALLAALAGLVVAADWLRLEEPQGGSGRAALLVAIAIVPALVRPRWFRLAAVVCAALVGLAVSFSVSLLGIVPGGEGFVTPIADRFGSGFVDFYAFKLPIAAGTQPRMHMLILVAIFAFTLLAAQAIAARRPVLAVAVFLVGAGWPSTLLAGGNEVARGAVILACALALLAGVRERVSRFAVPAVAVVLAAAVALSASPAVAKSAFLDWQHWNPYVRPVKPVSVSYVWNAQYNGIRFPRKVTRVLTIRAPQTIGTYWRATVLDEYEGDRWLELLWRETPLESHAIDPPGARTSVHFVQQEVTVDALADKHLVAASLPIVFNISEPALRVGQNVGIAPDGLTHGQRYIAWSYTAQPTPRDLVGSPATYPAALTRPGRELEISPVVTAPPFGVPGRDSILTRRLGRAATPYAQLLDRARQVVGDTPSPYAATVTLEHWFRTTGGFTYSTQPPATPGLPPLVGFVLDTKTGYCQHFAGAMALMLRLLGVPARVAVGFVRGTYRDGEWDITDHDAHAWVEVWFRGYGWLPFDPTPGRGTLAASYSSSSSRFDAAAEARLLSGVVRGGEVFGPVSDGTDKVKRPNVRSAADVGVPGLVSTSSTPHHSLARFLLLLALGVVAAIWLLKTLRRRARYVTRNPRRIAAACARELSEFLLDQRFALQRGASFGELQAAIEDRLAVDAAAFARAADAARFGSPTVAREAGPAARRELRELKRRLRRELFVLDRLRGVVSLRSFGFS